MSQLSYAINLGKALVGMIADNMQVLDIKSKRAEGSAVGFGLFVIKGTGDQDAKLPTAAFTLAQAEGVAVAAQTLEDDRGTNDPQYPQNYAMNVMRKGRIWVKAQDVITKGTSGVWVDQTNGRIAGADGGNHVDISTKARWDSSTTAADELAVLELDL